jgi:hypothetical protein
MFETIINYLKFSGASVSIMFNPFHWAWMPIMRKEGDLAWDQETYRFSILFLTIRIWIDDGSW